MSNDEVCSDTSELDDVPRAAISPTEVYDVLVAQLPELVDQQESQVEAEIADG